MTVQIIVGVFLLLLTIGLVYGIWKDEEEDLEDEFLEFREFIQTVSIEVLLSYVNSVIYYAIDSEENNFILVQAESELMFRNIESPNLEINQYFDDSNL